MWKKEIMLHHCTVVSIMTAIRFTRRTKTTIYSNRRLRTKDFNFSHCGEW